MNYLALIPARGGSKRVPRKNVRLLGGRPLIAWTIDLASRIGPGVTVAVSTDDQEIADASSEAGLAVAGLRPPHLSTDTATSLDVALYELARHEASHGKVDGLILLQPTSPFRRLETVLSGLDLFRKERRAVVGLCPAKTHPAWCFTVADGRIARYGGAEMPTRSQDLPPAFQLSGGLYVISPEQLRAERTFFPEDAAGVISDDEIETLDIDTEWDWLCAEQAFNAGLADGNLY